MNHKMVGEMRRRLDFCRKRHVETVQKRITFGNGRQWRDVEADEATFAKTLHHDAPEGEEREWEQWAGLIERGRHQSLFLWKTTPGRTCRRAPGPGAIKKVDWQPVAGKFLKDKKIVLHTDRAKGYQAKVPGMLHDSVRHCKKRVKVRGKWVWKKPVYAKNVVHTLKDVTEVKCKAGTQVIDRCWRFIRSHMQGLTAKPGSLRLAAAVRSAQWLYWNRGADLWENTAIMIRQWQW